MNFGRAPLDSPHTNPQLTRKHEEERQNHWRPAVSEGLEKK
jgi:hypothetical protein